MKEADARSEFGYSEYGAPVVRVKGDKVYQIVLLSHKLIKEDAPGKGRYTLVAPYKTWIDSVVRNNPCPNVYD